MKFYPGEFPGAEHKALMLKLGARVWVNRVYQVIEQPVAASAPGMPEMVWLSIKRRDKGVIRDWRQLQEIKNALLGPECEAVELFPAESRLVDEANQYHLWGFRQPGLRFPFGMHGERQVADAPPAGSGATHRQRPLRKGS